LLICLFALQHELLNKIVADLTDKVKGHPLEVRSLELSSKSTVVMWTYCRHVC